MTKTSHSLDKESGKYSIIVDGAVVGTAVKDKGKFVFTPEEGSGLEAGEHKTMRDLKVAAEKTDGDFIKANAVKAEPKAQSETAQVKEMKAEVEEQAVEAAAEAEDGDIDLD